MLFAFVDPMNVISASLYILENSQDFIYALQAPFNRNKIVAFVRHPTLDKRWMYYEAVTVAASTGLEALDVLHSFISSVISSLVAAAIGNPKPAAATVGYTGTTAAC